MSDASTPYPSRWRPPKFVESPVLRAGLWLLVLGYLVWSFGALEMDWERGSARAWAAPAICWHAWCRRTSAAGNCCSAA